MKKKIICVLAFALFLMIACTMLSAKIEEEMLTQVVAYEVEPKQAGRYEINLPLRYLYFDEEVLDIEHMLMSELAQFAEYQLFQLQAGTGWEDGLRIREVDKNDYVFDYIGTALTSFDETKGWSFVTYASRRPVDGEKAEVLTTKEKAQERYLVIYPEQIPEISWKLEGMSIAAQTENCLLLEVKEARQPFIQERAKEQIKDLNTAGCKVYSVETVEQFWMSLPAIAGVAVILFAALVIWIQSMLLLRAHWENRWRLTANFVLGLGLLWGLWYLMGKIDLPSDLLPAENIFEWSYYQQEFSQIMSALNETRGSFFDSMKHFGRTGQMTINLAFRMVAQTKRIVVVGAFLPVLWVSFFSLLKGRRCQLRWFISEEKSN